MGEMSARIGLPLLAAGQAQKEVYHNEALTIIDIVLEGAVEDHLVADPPASPTEGQCWIVAASPTGDWAGRAGQVAGWTAGGWRFVSPRPGMAFWHIPAGCLVRYDGSAWQVGQVTGSRLVIDGTQVTGAQQAAIPDPAGGATVDAQCRTALGQVLAALRSHGLIAT